MIASARPATKPIEALDVAATVLKFVYTNNAVSRPSLATAKKAAAASANGPALRAFSTLPCSSSFKVLAARFIQKTIQVTRPTAKNDVVPAKNCSPRSDNSAEVKLRKPPSAKVATRATPTPVQIGVSRWRRSVLTT